jgi:chromosome segregation ATPase
MVPERLTVVSDPVNIKDKDQDIIKDQNVMTNDDNGPAVLEIYDETAVSSTDHDRLINNEEDKPVNEEIDGIHRLDDPVKPAGVNEINSSQQIMEFKTIVKTSDKKSHVLENEEHGNTTKEIDEKKQEQLHLELLETKKILDVREMKLMEMSHSNMELHESNLELQKNIHEIKRESDNVKEINTKLNEQVEKLEKKIHQANTERDNLKRKLQIVEKEWTAKLDGNDNKMAELLKEKDEQIAGLMAEGEKLSKQELQFNNTIKKLRIKDKQNEQLIVAQKQQIEDVENEVKRLKDMIKKKEENEKKYQESLAQMNSISEQQAKDLSHLKPEREELTEKVRSLQANLDNAYKELSELRMSNALSQTAVEEAKVNAKQNIKEELKKELEEQRQKHEREKESLILEINELKRALNRAEQQVNWREEQLRSEISDLHKRLQESESRNQDLSNTISDATRPLLRQIEHLQSAHSSQASNWEKIEANLTQRLVESQTHKNEAIERERVAMEKEMVLQSKVKSLDNQVQSLRQERAQLGAALELEKTKLQSLDENYQRDMARHDSMRETLHLQVEELKKEKEVVEHQLEYERVRLEAESRKATIELQEKVNSCN